MMTMPMAKKFGAPVFLKKSVKYSTVSIMNVNREVFKEIYFIIS